MTPAGLRHGTASSWKNLDSLSLCLIEEWQNVGSPSASPSSLRNITHWPNRHEWKHRVPEEQTQNVVTPLAFKFWSLTLWPGTCPTKSQQWHLPQAKRLDQKLGQQKRWEEHVEAERLAMWHLLRPLEDQSTDWCCLLQTWRNFC